ncbi:hypothetical protein QN277_029042 [Acacia crassicarpa]|uniref:Uncharacterized protein n=1 Tax=Acacia crassicarpa TaxID=499986 RepID=A0AAE1J673_9FABA|nr:hypothetical protein QN277_029042 [Acacia crassicarpa]
MLRRVHKWKPHHFPRKSACLCPLSLFIFTKPSVSAAKVENEPVTASSVDTRADDPVREILTGLRNFGLGNFLAGEYFRSVFWKLNQPQVDQIIDSLRRENSDDALFFFYALRNDYGFWHSRDSQFVVAHVLASKRRFADLQLVIKEMLEQEGTTFMVYFGNHINLEAG